MENINKTLWHSASHILAQAVKRLYPDVKLGIGPAIDTGFYYDFATEKPFTTEDLAKIEVEMKKIIKENLTIERFELPLEEALEVLKDEPFKQELAKEHSDENLSFYKQGEFTDLCAGPHVIRTGNAKHFKLLRTTGAYWRGDSKNQVMSRIYGVAFKTKDELEAELKRIEEANQRDHNKLGRELELFTTVDVIGQGLPVMLPKGAKIIQILTRWIEDEEDNNRGYVRTKTPYLAKPDLYKISGHWEHYRDGMFTVLQNEKAKDLTADENLLALRPMTCPFQYQVFLNKKRSYRDLPMRLGETSTLFRNEDSGEMHGLIRVRQFTISEGHIILRPEQLAEEFKECISLAKYCLETLGLGDDVSYRFSQWDANNKEKFEGTAEQWEEAQNAMAKILDGLGLKYSVGIGEAAFYGPKLDIQIKNVHGKEDTLVTIQIDQMLAEKFGMVYTDTDGKEKHPYIIHRTSVGCYERTLALLIEKYAGAFPLWLAPEQVVIIPIADRHLEYAEEIAGRLRSAGMRIKVDGRAEKVGYKIRAAQLEKVPYMLILGDDEVANKTIAVRSRKDGDLGSFEYNFLQEKLLDEIHSKAY